MTERTLLLIKPNAVAHHHVGHIISIVEEHGFVLVNMKELQFDRELAERFYAVHKGKSFYERLVDFMCSGTTVAILLERSNAVEALRDLIGEVEPEHRKPGTIRALYAEGITENAVHASDSPDSARHEIGLLFEGV
jgi:nucleoside-diphosphate kinase